LNLKTRRENFKDLWQGFNINLRTPTPTPKRNVKKPTPTPKRKIKGKPLILK
jgi:hypothetical protein